MRKRRQAARSASRSRPFSQRRRRWTSSRSQSRSSCRQQKQSSVADKMEKSCQVIPKSSHFLSAPASAVKFARAASELMSPALGDVVMGKKASADNADTISGVVVASKVTAFHPHPRLPNLTVGDGKKGKPHRLGVISQDGPKKSSLDCDLINSLGTVCQVFSVFLKYIPVCTYSTVLEIRYPVYFSRLLSYFLFHSSCTVGA